MDEQARIQRLRERLPEFPRAASIVVKRDDLRALLAAHAALVAAAKVLHGAAYELLASPLTQAQWEALPQPYRDAVLTLEYKVDAYTLAVQPCASVARGEEDE